MDRLLTHPLRKVGEAYDHFFAFDCIRNADHLHYVQQEQMTSLEALGGHSHQP